MAVELEPLIIKLLGDASAFRMMTAQATASLQGLGAQVAAQARSLGGIQARLDNMGGAFGSFATGIAATAAGIIGVSSGFDLLKDSISLAAEAEQNEIAFGTMLQSAELGKKMVEDLQAFAAATPMDTSTLQTAAKTLLQFGVAGADILPTLQMLGDATGGNAERMKMMALSFGQMSGAGRLMGQDLLQMINAGFNPLMQMSKDTGKSIGDLKKEMEQGRISVDMVKEAFKNATGPGGMFAGLMEKQSKSLGGLFSTMKDDVDAVKRSLGKELIEGLNLKGVVQLVSMAAQAFQKWFGNLDKDTKSIIFAVPIGIAAITTAMLAAVVAAKLLSLGISLVTGAMAFLKITTLLSVASWIAWTAVSLLANAALIAIKVAIWLVNFALTTTNVLLGGLAIAMAAVIAVGFVAVIIALAAAVIAVYTAGKLLVDLLGTLPTSSGPVKALSDLFGGWATALKNVVLIARKDLPSAWELLQLEFAVAVAQVQDLFPPLWEFLKSSFAVVSHFMAETLEFEFKRSFLNIATEAADFFDFFGIANKVTGMKDELAKMNEEVDALQKSGARVAQTGLDKSLRNFNKDFKEGDATKVAKANRDFWMDWFGNDLLAEEDESIWTRLVKGIGPELQKGGAAAQSTQQKVKALKDELKFDAALFGSAEAFARIESFGARLGERVVAGTAIQRAQAPLPAFDAIPRGGAEAENRVDQQTDLLRRLLEEAQKANQKPEVKVPEAALT